MKRAQSGQEYFPAGDGRSSGRAGVPDSAPLRESSSGGAYGTPLPQHRGDLIRPATSFDAEDAPGLLARVFDSVTVYPWDAPLVTLPNPAPIRDYLVGRRVPAEAAATAAREMHVPLRVTKRGALIIAGRSSYGGPRIP